MMQGKEGRGRGWEMSVLRDGVQGRPGLWLMKNENPLKDIQLTSITVGPSPSHVTLAMAQKMGEILCTG